jgi:hypothetical protein
LIEISPTWPISSKEDYQEGWDLFKKSKYFDGTYDCKVVDVWLSKMED